LLALLAVIWPPTPVAAEPIFGPQATVMDSIPKQLSRGAVGLRVGILNTGSVELGTDERNPDPGATIGVFFDVPTVSSLMSTFNIDIYDIRMDPVSERFIDVSAGFKWVFHKSRSKLAWKPGAAVGLGYLAHIGNIRPSTYLTVKGFMELMFFTGSRHAWVFNLGVVAAPAGGNENYDITVDPSLYFQVGISY
jgi:hypothetical protein